jgi:quinohemoprotein ethanol dehydrogenase
VIIGNGGAEYGVRGYITAYDAETGEQKWRWYTVPGDPAKPFENEAMAKAAKTWDPAGKWWVNGRRRHRLEQHDLRPRAQPDVRGHRQRLAVEPPQAQPGGGDNLYLASIVALDPDTGKYVWHYQETPATTGTTPRCRT